MPINKFYIKKWYKMMTNQSILHVNQNIGKFYDKKTIKGYYNDLREKVSKSNLQKNALPKTELPNGEIVDFSIAIFQYGLGAYDLYLETNHKDYYDRFMKSVNWAVTNQNNDGGWVSFKYENNNPYSAMAQGEGTSLLIRAYNETKEKKYLELSTKAIECLMRDINNNGCTLYKENDVYLKEFPGKPIVLNGWIFSLFGVYDYYLITNKREIKNFYDKSVCSLIKVISNFDAGYWSKYDIDKKIASSFYHRLHIELLKVMYDLTGEDIFIFYSDRFETYQNKKMNRIKAFTKKVYQKLLER